MLPLAMQVLQREFWNGPPERLPDAFRMTKQKGDRALSAVCETWSHPFGWELRLMIDSHGLQMSCVVRSADEMLATADLEGCHDREGLELIGLRAFQLASDGADDGSSDYRLARSSGP